LGDGDGGVEMGGGEVELEFYAVDFGDAGGLLVGLIREACRWRSDVSVGTGAALFHRFHLTTIRLTHRPEGLLVPVHIGILWTVT